MGYTPVWGYDPILNLMTLVSRNGHRMLGEQREKRDRDTGGVSIMKTSKKNHPHEMRMGMIYILLQKCAGDQLVEGMLIVNNTL